MLATLDEIKTRLDIELADTSQDDALTTMLNAASQKVLDLCRYVETTGQVVEYHRNVQQAREFKLERRKVDPAAITVEGRSHGNDTFQTLASDLLDPDDGVAMILGSAEWWPPNYAEQRRPAFRRWREPIWPVVRVTYTAIGIGDEQSAPDELRQATLRLATYWREIDNVGATTSMKIGQLSQSWSDRPAPSDLRSILGRHYRGTSATWSR